ncbi:nitronate monooxygenase [Allopusillimonas ginsengisoli]|nr:nitronate monooxygenase [Allopusillimonas ginsengisoli]
MNATELCQRLKIDFPVFAFSHCRDVVVEVTNAGGLGVLGSIKMSPEELDAELSWIDERVGGKPYGVDLIVPGVMQGKEQTPTAEQVLAQLPEAHKAFAESILASHSIDGSAVDDETRKGSLYFSNNARLSGADQLLDIVFRHPVALIANALGVPPAEMVERGKQNDVLVAALVGTAAQAVRQAEAGVDLIIAAGGEAGGHCGEIGTMVLVPEVCAALQAYPNTTVLAAGGIVTGRQMAAAMCMGAAGVWCGSVWLTTEEAETPPMVKEKMLAARSIDTIRSRSRTGRFSRQLRSAWTDAWETAGAPTPLPMPLQTALVTPYLNLVDKLASGGNAAAQELSTYYVGQGVGLMGKPLSTRATMQAMREDFLGAWERLSGFLGNES